MRDKIKNLNNYIEKKLNKSGRRNLWIVLMIVAIVFIFITLFDNMMFQMNVPKETTTAEFMESLCAGDIDTIYYNTTCETMRYTLLNNETREMSQEERANYTYEEKDWRQTQYIGGEEFRREMLVEYGVNLRIKTFEPMLSGIWSMVFSIAVIVFVVTFVLVMAQNITMNQKKFNSCQGQVQTTFDDVIGQDEVLDDLRFIVRMMRGEKLDSLGARIPKGILLSGPPGTGKTLIARAVAGEAGVPFFSANASEFIDMYVGVGPKTVRTLFKQARKHKPCVVFIDEIDAVASTRGANGTTSEDNKTVNALLQEMDGFEKENGIFVIAATNNPDNLDPAIVRAGRFDRQVVVNPPRDWHIRKALFDLYINDAPCNANIENIARQTVGFTGADINAVVNEAKLVAAMDKKEVLDDDCFETAIDKKVFKANRSNSKQRENDIKIAAYHEAGHAVMTYLAGLPIARASIVGSTSGVGGAVFQADRDSGQFTTREEYESQVKICYGGRAAEYVAFKENYTDGACSDITQATKLIYAYVCKFGMCKEFGYLDVDVLKNFSISAVPNEVLQKLSCLFMEQTIFSIKTHFCLVEAVAQGLLEKETISGDDILKIIDRAKSYSDKDVTR